MAAWTETSSAEVGSSQRTSAGDPAKARAMATRCLSPPESAMRAKVEMLWAQADGRCERGNSRLKLCCGLPLGEQLSGAAQDMPYRMAWVERGVRVLEHHLHLAPQIHLAPIRWSGEIGAVEIGSCPPISRPGRRCIWPASTCHCRTRRRGRELRLPPVRLRRRRPPPPGSRRPP